MTVHLAVYHSHHLEPEDYLKYGLRIPHKGGVTAQVRRLKTSLKHVCLTWFVLESEDIHYDAVFLLLDSSITPSNSEHFKQFAGEAIAFWLEMGPPKQYYIKIFEDESRLITIEVSDIQKLTAFFNTKWTGEPYEIQTPEADAGVQNTPAVAWEPGEGQPTPFPE